MYGRNIGRLNVYANPNSTSADPRALIWSRGANMGDVWRKAHVATEFTAPFVVIFEGVVGNGIEARRRANDENLGSIFYECLG